MAKIPFERIALEADKLIQKMTLAKDIETTNYWWDAYVSLLQAAGWSPSEFDKEMSKRVDENWEQTKTIFLN